MKQKEVTDANNVRWTCVQAYAGAQGEVSNEIEQRSETDDGLVPVVCTPNGRAQSVRINLPKNWNELSDDVLLTEINKESDA